MLGRPPRVQIMVATHRAYRMPEDPIYLPLHVGAAGKRNKDGESLDIGYAKDDTGDNISALNAGFCELTGLYWAWKNIQADYIGLTHYRRHFSLKSKGGEPFGDVLRWDELSPLLKSYKIFLPQKRRYYIETLYTHYAHTHYASQLDEVRQIICERYPGYIASYDKVVRQTYGYMFNMMIMEKNLLDEYCSWLFDILFKLKERIERSIGGDAEGSTKAIDYNTLSAYQKRFYGRISEIIFNVWLDANLRSGRIQRDEIRELRCINMEKVDMWKKGTAFLRAKFFHHRYESSF